MVETAGAMGALLIPNGGEHQVSHSNGQVALGRSGVPNSFPGHRRLQSGARQGGRGGGKAFPVGFLGRRHHGDRGTHHPETEGGVAHRTAGRRENAGPLHRRPHASASVREAQVIGSAAVVSLQQGEGTSHQARPPGNRSVRFQQSRFRW